MSSQAAVAFSMKDQVIPQPLSRYNQLSGPSSNVTSLCEFVHHSLNLVVALLPQFLLLMSVNFKIHKHLESSGHVYSLST